MSNTDDIRKQARKHLKSKADFKNYLGVWLGVAIITVAVWAVTDFGGYFWPGWAIGGMGVGAFFQVLSIWGPGRYGITESAIDEEVRRRTGGNSGS